MMDISVEALTDTVKDILAEYQEAVNAAVEDQVRTAAKLLAAEINQNAAAQFTQRTGDYAKSWVETKNPQKYKNKFSRIVHSKAPEYRLTHLLEHGHAKVNGGWVAGRPHIAPAVKHLETVFPQMLAADLKNLK